LRDLFSRRRTHDDFSAEVQAHLDLETDRFIADGLSPEDARAAAQRAFGNVAIVKERFYVTSRWMWLEQFRQDLRYAWRGMRHSPSFVATTVLTLAVGLALITVAFTIFNAYVLRPFAIRDPGGLHQIVWHARDAGGQGFRWPDYEELSQRTDLFSAVIGEHTRFVSSNGRPLMAAVVSLNYFDALGPVMYRGRGLSSIDATGNGNPAVLSHQAWTRLFDRDPSAVGRDIELNGRAFTIVGVLAPPFTGLGDSPRDVFVPLTPIWTAPARIESNERRETEILVRLRPGVSRVQAESALTPVLTRIIPQQEDVRAEVRPQSSPNRLSVELLAVLSPIFGAFVLVLVTSCANVSNVMLARGIVRHREMAVRLSIGASRGRIVRQLLTEGLLIAALAGVAGIALAAWGLRVATVALFNTLPPSVAPVLRVAPLTFDYRVFLFAVVMSAAATLLFALLPALQTSRVSLTEALRGQGSSARRGSRLRNGLVIGQVAVALVLVITAVTIARNSAAVGAIDLGFDVDGVISVNVRGTQDELARPLADTLASDPRVAAVAVTSANPLFNAARIVAAAPADARAATRTRCTFVSPEFFSILRIPIARGRAFRSDEAATSARVAIVSAATANAFWPGEDPIGKTIRIEPPEGRPVDELPGYSQVIVIGTVRDIVTGMMVTGRDRGHIYLPMTSADVHATAILVRGRTDRDLGPEALQELFRRAGPDPQVFEALPLGEVHDLQMYPLLAASWVGWLLGAVALALSVSGLYGVLSYILSQRTKEIGIRMALGATPRAVMGLVLQQSTRLAGIGALVGAVVAFAVMKTLSALIQLEAISLVDIGAFAAGLALVLAATILAAYQPARRATRVDPSQTLRADA
jgi:putative ABC transport system permease protein